MNTLRDAVNAVQENLGALFLYLAITVGTQVPNLVYGLVAAQPTAGQSAEQVPLPFLLGLDLILSVGFATAQALAFSRMGKELDKPLWKLGGSRDALRRFFILWFVLNLLTLATIRAENALFKAEHLGLALPFVVAYYFCALLAIPLGTCVMFYGKLEWGNLGEILAPLVHQFPRTLMVLLIAVFQTALAETASVPDLPGLTSVLRDVALTVIGGYCDCLIFAGTWQLCMADREALPEEDDFEF